MDIHVIGKVSGIRIDVQKDYVEFAGKGSIDVTEHGVGFLVMGYKWGLHPGIWGSSQSLPVTQNWDFRLLLAKEPAPTLKLGGGVGIDVSNAVDCAGFINKDVEGCIFANMYRLEVRRRLGRKRFWVIVLKPPKSRFTVGIGRGSLSVRRGGAWAMAELRGNSNLSGFVQAGGRGFRSVRLEVIRSCIYVPRSLADRIIGGMRAASIQVIANLVSGSATFAWEPVRPGFNTTVAVLRSIDKPYIVELAKQLGALPGGSPLRKPFELLGPRLLLGEDLVLGEGPPVNYSVRLVMDVPMGKDEVDEAEITVNPV